MVIGRMDEGMSSLVLVSVPIFVLLGCVLDATGMGKAIVDFLASLLGHVKAGMSYVLLGSLFIVSGISGSKVSDMATVAPALFPEMKRRGHKPRTWSRCCATGAAMADTVPPSIVLIVLGSVAGVSIAGSSPSGFVVAMVLLLLCWWSWPLEGAPRRHARRHARADGGRVGRRLLVAGPALALPFLIRSRGRRGRGHRHRGVDARRRRTRCCRPRSSMAVSSLRKLYAMLVDTAALSGAMLLMLGTAIGYGLGHHAKRRRQQLSQIMTTLPGGALVSWP